MVHEDDVLTLRGHVQMTANADVRGVFIVFNPCKTHKKIRIFQKSVFFRMTYISKNPYFSKIHAFQKKSVIFKPVKCIC